MGLIEDAKRDWQAITSNPDEFGVALSFAAPTGETASVVGLHTKHHLSINTDGAPVNSKNAHVSVSEKLLTDLSYPVRDGSGEVNLKKHKVTVKDSTTVAKTYQVREWFPDETIGVIVMILGDFE